MAKKEIKSLDFDRLFSDLEKKQLPKKEKQPRKNRSKAQKRKQKKASKAETLDFESLLVPSEQLKRKYRDRRIGVVALWTRYTCKCGSTFDAPDYGHSIYVKYQSWNGMKVKYVPVYSTRQGLRPTLIEWRDVCINWCPTCTHQERDTGTHFAGMQPAGLLEHQPDD